MSRRTIRTVTLISLALVVAGCGKEADKAKETVKRTATTLANKAEGATRLTATLSGTTEVPAGDPDGSGSATVNLDVTKRRLCYEVTVHGIDQPVAMHIHEGEAGKSGGIVVPLTTPTANDTTTTGCADVDAALIARIAARPGNYYVNVHTGPFPQGAVRGQLSQ